LSVNVFLVSNLFKSLFALKKSPNDVGMMFILVYDYCLEEEFSTKTENFAGVSIEIQIISSSSTIFFYHVSTNSHYPRSTA